MARYEKPKEYRFTGPLAGPISGFLEDMRLSGHVYNAEGYYLTKIDQATEQLQASVRCLSKEFVESWAAKRPYESQITWLHRVTVIRKLAQYMLAHGMAAFQTQVKIQSKRSEFTPHIYTDAELRQIFEQSDFLPSYANCPNRTAVSSLIFRMIYGCGLRLSEALNLQMRDVDLDVGVLTIMESKFDKSRYVPMSPELTERCKRFTDGIRKDTPPDAPFYPSPCGDRYSKRAMNSIFRQILYAAGIPHMDRGPRIHDLRHTFSINCLKKWILAGKDLNAALPVLTAYLGHKNLGGTQDYLRLTANMYPSVSEAVEKHFGYLVPGKELFYEEN